MAAEVHLTNADDLIRFGTEVLARPRACRAPMRSWSRTAWCRRAVGTLLPRDVATALVRGATAQRGDVGHHRAGDSDRLRGAGPARRPGRHRAGAGGPSGRPRSRAGQGSRRQRRRGPQLQPLRHRRLLHPPGGRGRLRRVPVHERQPGHGAVGRSDQGRRHQSVVDRRTGRPAGGGGHGHRQHRRRARQDLPGRGARRGHSGRLGRRRDRHADHRRRPGGARTDPADGRPQGLRHLLHDGRAGRGADRQQLRPRRRRTLRGRQAQRLRSPADDHRRVGADAARRSSASGWRR